MPKEWRKRKKRKNMNAHEFNEIIEHCMGSITKESLNCIATVNQTMNSLCLDVSLCVKMLESQWLRIWLNECAFIFRSFFFLFLSRFVCLFIYLFVYECVFFDPWKLCPNSLQRHTLRALVIQLHICRSFSFSHSLSEFIKYYADEMNMKAEIEIECESEKK